MDGQTPLLARAEAPPSQGIRPWTVFVLVYLIGTVGGAATAQVGPIVRAAAASLHANIAAVGATMSLLFLPGAFLGTAVGFVVDRIGTRPALLLSAVLFVLTDGLILVASDLFLFSTALLVQGLALSALLAAGQATLMASFSGGGQARALAGWSTVGFVGYAVGLVLGGVIGAGDWRLTFGAHAAISAAVALAALKLPSTRAIAGQAASQVKVSLLREIGVLRLGLALGLATVAGVGLNASISLYLHDHRAVALSVAASAVAFGNLLCISAGIALGWAINKGFTVGRLVLAVGTAAGLAGAGLYLPWIAFPGTLALLYLYQFSVSTMTGLTYVALPKLLADPRRTGAASGFIIQSSLIGATLGPALFFAATVGGRWRLASLLVLGLWAALLVIFPRPRPAPPGKPI